VNNAEPRSEPRKMFLVVRTPDKYTMNRSFIVPKTVGSKSVYRTVRIQLSIKNE